MSSGTAPLFRTADDQPVASTRRGVCPSLSKPMQTGDGLLVRLRPASGGLTPAELAAIARAAAEFGNGILEVTARGNLQIRGLTAETVQPLTEAVFATGIDLATGLAVETPPLSGLDSAEIVDARRLAARLRQAVAAEEPPLRLAAKLSVIVDGGGPFSLDAVVADLRLKATRHRTGTGWALSLGGTAETARPVALYEEADVVGVVMEMLRQLHGRGTEARGRDIDITGLPARGHSHVSSRRKAAILRPAGLHPLADGSVVAGLGLAFCQVKSADLLSLCDEAARLDVGEFRLAPNHGFLIPGLDARRADQLLVFAAGLGFLASPDDPANSVSVCAGIAGCASAFFDTHAAARLLIREVPELLDGSHDLHLSGCPKGCAHPAPALLTLVGAPLGYGLVVNGPASHSPQAYIAANDVATAVQGLLSLVRTRKDAGESARSCLTRLGSAEIAAALRQE